MIEWYRKTKGWYVKGRRKSEYEITGWVNETVAGKRSDACTAAGPI